MIFGGFTPLKKKIVMAPFLHRHTLPEYGINCVQTAIWKNWKTIYFSNSMEKLYFSNSWKSIAFF